ARRYDDSNWLAHCPARDTPRITGPTSSPDRHLGNPWPHLSRPIGHPAFPHPRTAGRRPAFPPINPRDDISATRLECSGESRLQRRWTTDALARWVSRDSFANGGRG